MNALMYRLYTVSAPDNNNFGIQYNQVWNAQSSTITVPKKHTAGGCEKHLFIPIWMQMHYIWDCQILSIK